MLKFEWGRPHDKIHLKSIQNEQLFETISFERHIYLCYGCKR